MSSDRQHRVHDFLCAPKITTSASLSVGYRVLVTMSNINPEDCCRVCSFVFVSRKRKRNIDGEFRKIFEEVFNQKLLTDDGLPHAVCNACHYRVQRMWKSKPSAVVIRVNELSKRRHPLSPLTSSQGDEQTSYHISKKKFYRIPFENVPIRPKPSIHGNKEVKILHEESTQTRKSSCHCFPVSTKGTSVKVCTVTTYVK